MTEPGLSYVESVIIFNTDTTANQDSTLTLSNTGYLLCTIPVIGPNVRRNTENQMFAE